MHRLIVSCLSLALAGCVSSSAKHAGAPVPGPAADVLYEQIQLQSQRYEAALEQGRHGDADAARTQRSEALAELQDAAVRCAALPGCESARFFAAYSALLERSAVSHTDEGFVAEDAPDAAQDEGGSPLLAELPAAGRTITLLKGRELRDVIAINGPVKAALNEWLTWMRPQLIEAHENYQVLRSRMWPEYEHAGLPEALLFGILAKESAGKVHAMSRAGAAGPLQFMPATGRRFGLGRAPDGFDTRFDPQLAARANVQYLNERFGDFNDDLALALAAYNGGEGRMQRLYRDTRRKTFWDPALNTRLPPETRDYVPMVLAAAWLFLHPDEYGIVFPKVDAAPGRLTLAQSASINELAICLGQDGSRSGWFRALRNLNPRYEPHAPIAAGTVLSVPNGLLAAYDANCRAGKRQALAADLAGAAKRHPAAGTTTGTRYTVRSGDTLASIARRHQCSSPQALAQANGIRAPRYMIKPGQTLQLSGCRA